MAQILCCLALRARYSGLLAAPMRSYIYRHHNNLRFMNQPNSTFSSSQETVDNNHQLQFVNVDQTQNRQLYTRNTLGLDKLELHKATVSHLYKNRKDDYISRLKYYVENGNHDQLLQYDLINLIGLADCEQHLDLIEQMITVFASNNQFFSSGWGTAIMRLYYIMNQYDRANKNIRDETTFGQLFNRKSCYRIAMTMLFNAGRYQDVIEIYNLARKRLEPTESNGSPQHPGISVLAFGSYAKMNSPEALKDVKKLYNDVNIELFSSYLRMRVLSFLAYMSINQGEYQAALDMISSSPIKNYIILRELKTIALIKMNRYEDVVRHILDSLASLERDSKLVLKDVNELVESNLDNIKNDKVRLQLKDILIELQRAGLVGSKTLDSLLYTGINNQKVREQLDPWSQRAPQSDRQRRLRMKAQLAKVP